jgi:hypothetical protein
MPNDGTKESTPPLQFDRALSGDERAATEPSTPQVSCAVCSKAIASEYFHANGVIVCESCCREAKAQATTARGAGPLLRAVIFGIGAAIAGAIVYYAVIAITKLEIGIVAILIGYMVGWAVRKASKGRGGRRFQILAALLTYWAVGLAYTPLAMKELMKDPSSTTTVTASADSAKAVAPLADSTKASVSGADSAPGGGKSLAIAIVFMLGFVFALPVLAIASSMPSGLLSAFIIFIGLQQAWRMTGAPKLDVSGPYKIGGRAPATS